MTFFQAYPFATLCLLMAGAALFISLLLFLVRGRFWPLPFAACGVFLLWAYSFPPLRFSYRGGGELLQMVGVGVVLPLYGYTSQGGDPGRFPLIYFAPLLPLQLACALSTALPDAPSDRAGRKHTLAVLWGLGPAKAVVIGLYTLALGIYAALWPDGTAYLLLPAAPLLGVVAMAAYARPGTTSMFLLVLFSNLTTITFMLSMMALLLRMGGPG